MGKEHKNVKMDKKKPAKTLKEKRAEKKAKKDGKESLDITKTN